VAAVVRGAAESPSEATRATLVELFARWWDGRIKLFVLTSALRRRRELADAFLLGDYVPLEPDTSQGHLIAFARRAGNRVVIAVAPRFLATRFRGEPQTPLGAVWQTARVSLPPDLERASFVNVLTGETVRPLSYRGDAWLMAGDMFATWPVAWLEGK
jgi:(1->4)-alpha-D-glucan 1-alpha-D-glucosylmutase